jgi:RNA polymerase sigma factor (sigma-70 family)
MRTTDPFDRFADEALPRTPTRQAPCQHRFATRTRDGCHVCFLNGNACSQTFIVMNASLVSVERRFVRKSRFSRNDKAIDGSATPSEAFSQFVIATRDQLLRALRAHVSPDIAAEVLADAYAYAWAHWSRITALDNPTGYVYRVAERIGYRMESTRRQSTTTYFNDAVERPEMNWVNHFAVTDRYTDRVVVDLLHGLPHRQRGCVLLIHGYGWTYKQTAETLGLPLSTVTNEATRGLQKLRDALKPNDPASRTTINPPQSQTAK